MATQFRRSVPALLVVLCFAVPSLTHADNSADMSEALQQLTKGADPQDVRNAEIDFEYDAANCAAYYRIEYAAAVRSGYGNTSTAKGMDSAANMAMALAVQVSDAVGMR